MRGRLMNDVPGLREPIPDNVLDPTRPQAREDRQTDTGTGGQSTSFIIGHSAAMRLVFEQIRRFAACDAPVLVTGESGTGKELVARAIHDHSRRRNEQFVAVNCAAMPAGLIASELCGYEKGAFTRVTAWKHGLIEHAHRGTLFL